MQGLFQIKASAGSGKTHTLTRRFLSLLSSGHSLQEICAITFTNAAAQEMRSRILVQLKECALGQSSELPKALARSLLNNILYTFSALQVRTIDSLLLQIVRTSSLALRLSPDFTPVFSTSDTVEPFLETLSSQAVAGDTDLAQALSAIVNALYIEGDAKGFIAGRRVKSRLSHLFSSILLKECEDLSSEEIVRQKRAETKAALHDLSSSLLAETERNKWKVNAKKVITALSDQNGRLEDLLHTLDSAYLQKESCTDLFCKGAAPETETAEALYHGLTIARPRFILLTDALKTLPFITFGRRMVEAYNQGENAPFSLHTVLIPRLVQAIFEGLLPVQETLFALGNSLTHLLIDEFQDTSDEQWRALEPLIAEALGKGGSFTWVGDIKQSIFSWRGGNPALFDAILNPASPLSRVLPLVAPEHIHRETLPYNWRSCEAIVHFNNRLYAPLENQEQTDTLLARCLPRETPEEVRAAARKMLTNAFHQMRQAMPPGKGNSPSKSTEAVHLEVCEQEEVGERIAHLVLELAGKRSLSDLLILVRTNDEAQMLAHTLLGRSIPVVTENSLLLAQHALIIESIAFLKFLVFRDQLSFFTVVSGSIFALPEVQNHFSVEELEEKMLLLAAEAAGSAQSDQPASPRPDASDPAQRQAETAEHAERAQIGCEHCFRTYWPELWERYFAVFSTRLSLLSPYDLLSEWYAFMRVEERFPDARVFVRRLLEILHTAGDEQCGTLSVFLEYWEQNNAAEKVPMPEQMDAVRIMTIHKAKGLEAPVVIVPSKRQAIRTQDTLLFHETEDGLKLATRLNKHAQKAYYEDYLRIFCENINLLYVATTRACEELFILRIPSTYYDEKDVLAALASLAGFTFEKSDAQAKAEHREKPEEACANAHEPEKTLCQQKKPAALCLNKERDDSTSWRPMHWLPALKIAHSSTGSRQARKDLLHGTLLHTALEHILYAEEAGPAAARALAFALYLHKNPVLKAQEQNELQRALVWFLGLPQSRDWLARGLREQSLMSPTGRLLRTDLLVPPRAGRTEPWLIIDYKSALPDESETQLRYQTMLRTYGAVLTAQGRPWKGLLIYLHNRRLQLVDALSTGPLCADLPLDEALS